MSMNSYNRSNPFMYLLESENQKVQDTSELLIRDMLFVSFFSIVSIIISLIDAIIKGFNDVSLILIIILITPIILAWIIIYDCIRKTRKDNEETIDMIFSKKYESINLNNERLVAQIVSSSTNFGKISVLREIASYLQLYYITSIVITIIHIIIMILK